MFETSGSVGTLHVDGGVISVAEVDGDVLVELRAEGQATEICANGEGAVLPVHQNSRVNLSRTALKQVLNAVNERSA